MKLKLKKKPDDAEKSPTPIPATDQNAPVIGKIYVDENGQRRVQTQMFHWMEVFATPDKELVDAAKIQFGRHLISSFLLFDFDSKEFILFTTETFYSEARRVIVDLGHKPWGVGDD